ncbi:trans-sialidase, putative, partial [Trypanosoma cruzi marinkellei]
MSKLKTQLLEKFPFGTEQCPSQKATKDNPKGEANVHVSRPTTVVKGSDIYMLAGNYSLKYEPNGHGSQKTQWGLLLARGNVSSDGNNGDRIYWNSIDALQVISNIQQDTLTRLIGGGGSGIKTKGDTLLFPVEGTKENEGKTVSLLLYSKDARNWKLSKGMSDGGCTNPSVVEWKNKLMMMTACDGGRRRVYESGDKGESWTEALGTLSRVWGNKKGEDAKDVGSGFITATIDGAENDEKRDVMLVTLPVYAKEEKGNEKGKLHLWLTDNTHIADIGPVSGNDDAAASSLLYKSGNNNEDEKMIALYEKKKADGETPSLGMASVLLTEQLKRVKEVLKTWKEVDVRVSKLCLSKSDEKDRPSVTPCSSNFNITDGLVGFLSGNFSETTWSDEYLGVNATVRDGTAAATVAAATKAKVASDKGVTFRGAWAEWPVGKQGENQLYHFANYKFTLVATVSIDGEPTQEGPIPLMGVKINDEGKSKLMELSYDKEKRWRVLCSDGTTKKLKSTWVPQTQYQVAIVLRNGTQGTVYVDGQRVCEGVQRKLENTGLKGISHFYIGGGVGSTNNKRSQEVVPVTVRNVLLYNRPWTLPGRSAEVEEDISSPSEDTVTASEDQEPPEAAAHTVARGQEAVPAAGKPSE